MLVAGCQPCHCKRVQRALIAALAGTICALVRWQHRHALALASLRKQATTPTLIKIRTITSGVTFERGCSWALNLERAAAFNAAAKARFESAGFEVQTTRIAANPFEEWLDVHNRDEALSRLRSIDADLEQLGVDLFNAGPASSAAGRAFVPQIVALSPRMFASASLADPLDSAGAEQLADAILGIAACTLDGEGNFRFCASFNCPPCIPFFPASYHDGSAASFAIGCETAAILADALPRANGDLACAKALLTRAFEEQLRPVDVVAHELSTIHRIAYRGIDASIAPLGPLPPLTSSFESLGLGCFGESGTLAAAALVTGAVKAITGVSVCGYSGLMLPPCEDRGLAEKAAEHSYTLHDILAYSAVCGLGLDTVPIPGDVPRSKLKALLLDVAALAFRLDKPLTARLLPVPGKRAGERTCFTNPCLVDTVVFDVP